MTISTLPALGMLRSAAVLAAAALVLACATPNLQEPERRRELLVEGSRQIDVVVDGVGPAVVLLPSARRDSLDYDELAGRIAREGFMVLRPQPRGMGRSSAPPPDMTLATLASDVALTIERLAGGKPAIVVGHAYGHWVARVTDMNHPKLVRGVVVLGASAKVYPSWLPEALGIASDPARPEAERIAALKKSMFAPGNDPRPWLEGWYPQWGDAYRKASLQPAKDLWFNSANAPMLDLQGAQDAWRPPASRNELKDLFGSKVTGGGDRGVGERVEALIG
jgi:pimeloyl-ACP methyl ester carboxylesterase